MGNMLSKFRTRYAKAKWRWGKYIQATYLDSASLRAVGRKLEWVVDRRPPRLDQCDVVVLSVVRNGALHIDTFLDHHLALGVRHVILMDNGSDDDTVERAATRDEVSIVRCDLPFAKLKHSMRRYLVTHFARHGWCFVLDVDEHLYYPGESQASLHDFITYLDNNGYTGVAGQLLDLFPDGPPSQWPTTGAKLVSDSRWYDLSHVRRVPYWPRCHCVLPPGGITRFRGGIRETAFGADVDLTKAPIVNGAKGVLPAADSSHQCRNAKLADVTVLLAHYKFHRDFEKTSDENIRRVSHSQNSAEYQRYSEKLRQNPKLRLHSPSANLFTGAEQLVDNAFLKVSQQYKDWLAQRN